MWTWLPASDAIISVAAAKYGKLPDTNFPPSTGREYLACAAEAGLPTIFTNDRHLLAAAPHFGLTGATVS